LVRSTRHARTSRRDPQFHSAALSYRGLTNFSGVDETNVVE
jgi:hypothetical protein